MNLESYKMLKKKKVAKCLKKTKYVFYKRNDLMWNCISLR